MAKFIPDTTAQHWVIMAPERITRPENNGEEHFDRTKHDTGCPFCTGNEHETPPEVFRIGEGNPDTPGWFVRVTPNKFPITDIHEVIIHGPTCDAEISGLPVEHIERILCAYKQRFNANKAYGNVLIFCNQGAKAGASLKHPHSQLVVVPRQIRLDALVFESFENIIEDTGTYISYCPSFSQWPYEMWIAPKTWCGTLFGDITTHDLMELAVVLKRSLNRIEKVLDDTAQPLRKGEEFVYNYYIYHGKNWFVRIIPRVVSRAGFELGTGLSVNIVDPTVAAKRLRAVQVG